MNPKCAWIDYCRGQNFLFAFELRERGIQLDEGDTLDEFLSNFDLNDYSVLLYHPGRENKHMIREVTEKYPNTKLALITAPSSGVDYGKIGSDLPCFTYNVNAVEKFIRENQ